MSASNPSISKIERMMHKMHIDDDKDASSQMVLPMILKNRSSNRFSHHQHQNQHQGDRDRSRFFYKLRLKKKQRRLQREPRCERSHRRQHEREKERNSEQQERLSKLVTVIVGSSIARNITVRNIESESDEVRLRFKSGSDCADALAWLQSTDGQFFVRGTHQLVFILGTNDLHQVGAFQTVQRIDYTVATVRQLYPEVNVVWQLLQQRTRQTRLLPGGQAVLNEIDKCNMLLLELAAERRFDTIQPAIPIQYMYDGLHPSKHGVEMMEGTIRNYLEKVKMVCWSPFSFDCCNNQIGTSAKPLMSISF